MPPAVTRTPQNDRVGVPYPLEDVIRCPVGVPVHMGGPDVTVLEA